MRPLSLLNLGPARLIKHLILHPSHLVILYASPLYYWVFPICTNTFWVKGAKCLILVPSHKQDKTRQVSLLGSQSHLKNETKQDETKRDEMRKPHLISKMRRIPPWHFSVTSGLSRSHLKNETNDLVSIGQTHLNFQNETRQLSLSLLGVHLENQNETKTRRPHPILVPSHFSGAII